MSEATNRELMSRSRVGVEVVQQLTGRSAKTITRWVRSGEFPAPVAHAGHLRQWARADIQAWLDRTAGTPMELRGAARHPAA